ncbi:unnamed protein product [Blepharisma stoltei]|uniref:Receptor ligand binding region domain-containing protein n=1 Tax=Blepharisma stoltei TaxID=1481888 RepID=A0AAU9IVY2_9CILI|nr:unnamed protein product [Blepharisma stoltei]
MNSVRYLTLILLSYSLGDLLIYILYSQQTNINLLSDLKNNLPSSIFENEYYFDFQFVEITANQTIENILEAQQTFITIDVTFDVYWSSIIYHYTERNQIVNLNLNFDSNSYGEWQFFIHNSIDQHQNAAGFIIDFFEWKNFAIISNESPINLKLALNVETKYRSQVSQKLVLPDSISDESIENLISKIIKPNGIQLFFILEEGYGLWKFIEKLKSKKIYKKGAGIIVGSTAIWAPAEDGVTIYVEKGLETAQSYSEYEILAIKQFTDIILDFKSKYPSIQIDSLLLRQLFESNTFQHRKLPIFSVVNIYNSQKIIKAQIEGWNATIFNSTFFYPGNTAITPKRSETEIVVSIASGSAEPDGSTNIYNPQNFLGSLYAQWVINNSTSLLKNFYISQFQTNCGSSIFDLKFYYTCMRQYKDQLGVAFLSPSFDIGAIGYIYAFRGLGVEIPHCGASTVVSFLSNKTEYPEYMRISTSGDYIATNLAKIISYLGWTHAAVIFGNNTYNYPLYKKLYDEFASLRVSIMNDENKKLIPQNYLRTDFEQYKYIFKHIYSLKVRICLLVLGNPYAWHAIEGLYDVGFRKGDIILFVTSKAGGSGPVFNDLDEHVIKRTSLMDGSLSGSINEYVGNYGEKIKQEIIQAFYPYPPSYKCYSFDAFMLVAHGLDYTINQGSDIENPWLLNKNLRKQRFISCSGLISIESNSNNRNYASINFNNFYYNKTDKTYYEVPVTIVNLGTQVLFEQIQEITWPGNSHTTPNDMRDKNFDCPFEEKITSHSEKGIGVFFGICFAIFSISIYISFLIWKKYKKVYIPKLLKTKKLKFADMMVYSVIAVEFFQYLYLGPPILSINSAVTHASDMASLDFSKLTSIKRTAFWIQMIITICIAWLMVFLNFFTMTKLRNCFIFNFLANIRSLLEILMPLLGNILFVPILLFLLNIFACTHTTGNSVLGTYLDKDCYQYCWEDKHLLFVFLCLFTIFVYVPLTIYYRPVYQDVQESLHIKTMPSYLVIKSFAQIFFVIFKKTIGLWQPEIHGFLYFVFFSIYIWMIYLVKPYNYDKICLILIISMLMVAWSVFWTSIANVVMGNLTPWICCQLIGWAVIFILGYLKAKKLPSLIITESGS